MNTSNTTPTISFSQRLSIPHTLWVYWLWYSHCRHVLGGELLHGVCDEHARLAHHSVADRRDLQGPDAWHSAVLLRRRHLHRDNSYQSSAGRHLSSWGGTIAPNINSLEDLAMGNHVLQLQHLTNHWELTLLLSLEITPIINT